MGIDCNIKDLGRIWNINNHYPVFSILQVDRIANEFKDFYYIALGEILSSSLLKYGKDDRKDYVIYEMDNIFHNMDSKKLIIDHIDILFNPDYRIDILGYFIQLARNRRIIVIWPGEYVSGTLTYATPEYRDYKKYSIKDYNIICLI